MIMGLSLEMVRMNARRRFFLNYSRKAYRNRLKTRSIIIEQKKVRMRVRLRLRWSSPWMPSKNLINMWNLFRQEQSFAHFHIAKDIFMLLLVASGFFWVMMSGPVKTHVMRMREIRNIITLILLESL